MRNEFEICNIYPIANQKWYAFEKYVMLLAHLWNEYEPKWFNENQYIIMDNGLFEGKQISTDLNKLIEIAGTLRCKGIYVNEIVIPDAINDVKKTQQLFLDNLIFINAFKNDYKFMYVAQANNTKQLREQIKFIENMVIEFSLQNCLVVGISKLTPLARDSYEVKTILDECSLPIHFLGLKIDFVEAYRMSGTIRSVDTSQLCHNVKNNKSIYHSRDIINDTPIDLEKDVLDDEKIKNELVRSWYRY